MLKLTKLSGKKSHETSLEVGQFVIGIVENESVFPQRPAVGRPFCLKVTVPTEIDYYKTSVVEEVTGDIFKTYNSTYKLEEL